MKVASVWGIITLSEGVLGAFLAGTWWWALRRQSVHIGWRHKASVVGLALPTIALVVEFAFTAVAAMLGGLAESDEASLRGGWWYAVADRLWICSFLATGPLSFFGLILATIGRGTPRIAAAVWSLVVMGTFLVNLVLVVNSFH